MRISLATKRFKLRPPINFNPASVHSKNFIRELSSSSLSYPLSCTKIDRFSIGGKQPQFQEDPPPPPFTALRVQPYATASPFNGPNLFHR